MKRNIMGRLFTLATLCFVVCVALFSCAQENPLEESPEILSGETAELQKAFAREYRECSMRSDAMRDSIFGFEGLKPQWQSARSETTGNGIRFIEVPLNADLAVLPVSSSLFGMETKKYAGRSNLTYLMRKENLKDRGDGGVNYFMSILPDKKMLDANAGLKHKPGHLPPHFTGEVLFFDLQGINLRWQVYSDGVLIHDYEPIYTSSELRVTVVEECRFTEYRRDYYYYADENNHKHNFTTYRYEIHCSTHVHYFDHSGGEGGGGSGGFGAGAGGGNGNWNDYPDVGTDDEKLKDPCENMKSKSENKAFMDELDKLKDLASGTIEYGRSFTYDGTNFTFTAHDGEADMIDYTPSASHPIDGFIHTHNVDRGHWPIFTGDDLFRIYDWYINGGIHDIETFTMGLVTKDGCYFLKITDVDKFKDYFSTGNDLVSLLNYCLVPVGCSGHDVTEAVNGMVKFLAGNPTGLCLFELNKNKNKFHQKIYTDREIINNYCE